MPIIEIHNVTYCYNPETPYEKRALHNISLSIEKGEFLGVVGANGSGKSTLIQHLNGLLCPSSGKIAVMGKDTQDKSFRSQLWKHVGLVFQFPEQQLFEATVYEELAYGLKNMGLDPKEIESRILEALDNVGLKKDLLPLSPFCLSGGTRRRVAVASVLAMKPEILVLDEPTAGLDPEGSAQILHTIKKYQKENDVTVIMVSHYINELILLSDRLVVLDQGKLCAWGTTREVLACEGLQNHEILLPEYLKILFDLKKQGWEIHTGLLTVEEAADEIHRLLREVKYE